MQANSPETRRVSPGDTLAIQPGLAMGGQGVLSWGRNKKEWHESTPPSWGATTSLGLKDTYSLSPRVAAASPGNRP